MVDSREILSTLYSSELRFLISSRCDSNSCLASASACSNSCSMAAMMSCISFFCLTCQLTISVRSVSNSSSRAWRLKLNSSSRRLTRVYWRSISASRVCRCDRSAIWYCSSASSRSRSSIWMMASLRSTSRSWFWERISISLRRSSTLARRMILRHWLWILIALMTAYFSSFSCRLRSFTRDASSLRRLSSSALSISISRRAFFSASVSLTFTLAPPLASFLAFTIFPGLPSG
mmetsp:Transcript_57745/g.182943  ORF Transcript_57745/g.182943 Transcript_57745/m.182943 type:complete len:233 (-) Transcript_57745:150-848(-)